MAHCQEIKSGDFCCIMRGKDGQIVAMKANPPLCKKEAEPPCDCCLQYTVTIKETWDPMGIDDGPIVTEYTDTLTWVAEEEIYGAPGYWWTSDGRYYYYKAEYCEYESEIQPGAQTHWWFNYALPDPITEGYTVNVNPVVYAEGYPCPFSDEYEFFGVLFFYEEDDGSPPNVNPVLTVEIIEPECVGGEEEEEGGGV